MNAEKVPSGTCVHIFLVEFSTNFMILEHVKLLYFQYKQLNRKQ